MRNSLHPARQPADAFRNNAVMAHRNRQSRRDAFTIVEVLVAAAVLLLIVVLLLNMVTQTSKTWKATTGKIEQFRDARDAFDTMTRRLGQATLNTYLDYDNPTNPTAYGRQSQLRFLSGPIATILPSVSLPTTNPTMAVFFQAPTGYSTNSSNSILQNSLNTWGYFIEYGGDAGTKPGFLPSGSPPTRYRYRLMELMEPTENMSVYNYTTNSSLTNPYTGNDWITNSMLLTTNRPAHVVAENIIALILLPHLSPADLGTTYDNSSLAPSYNYDSSRTSSLSTNGMLNPHNQLPPVIQVTLIAVDETSAIRSTTALQNITNNSPSGYGNLFTNAANFTTDLAKIQTILTSNKINYRVFTTDVMIRGAKWSGAQTN
jgi:hypothetical protein